MCLPTLKDIVENVGWIDVQEQKPRTAQKWPEIAHISVVPLASLTTLNTVQIRGALGDIRR
jgi:hypothetical protein